LNIYTCAHTQSGEGFEEITAKTADLLTKIEEVSVRLLMRCTACIVCIALPRFVASLDYLAFVVEEPNTNWVFSENDCTIERVCWIHPTSKWCAHMKTTKRVVHTHFFSCAVQPDEVG